MASWRSGEKAWTHAQRGASSRRNARPGDDGLRRQWGPLGDQAASLQAMARRCDGGALSSPEAEDYARSAEGLLKAAQRERDRMYLDGLRQLVLMEGAIRQFAFGSTNSKSPWKAVAADGVYTPAAGCGWLADEDDSAATPEESDYAMAQKYGQNIAKGIIASRLLFWPYKEPPPAPLRANLGCGSRRRFRVDLPPGTYTVRVVTTNPSWTNRNFLVSGMVAAQATVRLADVVQDRGTLVGASSPWVCRTGNWNWLSAVRPAGRSPRF